MPRAEALLIAHLSLSLPYSYHLSQAVHRLLITVLLSTHLPLLRVACERQHTHSEGLHELGLWGPS
jgi:hypothetical protein